MSWNGEFIVQLLVATGVAGAVGQFITYFRERRKIGAEAGDLIQQAAGRQVERLEAEIKRLREQMEEDNTEMKAQLANERLDNRRLRAALTARRVWEDSAYEVIRGQGIELPMPPPWDL